MTPFFKISFSSKIRHTFEYLSIISIMCSWTELAPRLNEFTQSEISRFGLQAGYVNNILILSSVSTDYSKGLPYCFK